MPWLGCYCKEKQKPLTNAKADAWAKQAEVKSRKQAQKEHAKEYVQKSMEDFYKHPLTNLPGMVFGSTLAPAGVFGSRSNWSITPSPSASSNVGLGNLVCLGLFNSP